MCATSHGFILFWDLKHSIKSRVADVLQQKKVYNDTDKVDKNLTDTDNKHITNTA